MTDTKHITLTERDKKTLRHEQKERMRIMKRKEQRRKEWLYDQFYK